MQHLSLTRAEYLCSLLLTALTGLVYFVMDVYTSSKRTSNGMSSFHGRHLHQNPSKLVLPTLSTRNGRMALPLRAECHPVGLYSDKHNLKNGSLTHQGVLGTGTYCWLNGIKVEIK